VNSEAMCTLLSWLQFSTPKEKKNEEEKHGSVLQTSREMLLNLIKSRSTSSARILPHGAQSTKLEQIR